MRILVVGCGSIGARHIRNLRRLHVGEVSACDTDKNRLQTVKEECSLGRVYTDLKDALAEGFDAVLVCTPPSTHMPIARECIERDAHLFIEKPLSNTLEGVHGLIREASAKKRVLSVGYNFRFDLGLGTVNDSIAKKDLGEVLAARAQFGQFLPDWRPWQDYTQSYTARQDLGGGIILDGSHELDYLRWLIGDVREVSCFAGKAANLEADTEGIAEILLRFESGCLGEVHLDFVRPGYIRDCEIIGETGVVRWDYTSRTVSKFEPGAKEWQSLTIAGNNEDMYIAEMRNFIASIQGLEKPVVSGLEGMKSLEVALAAKESAATGKVVRL